MANKKQREINIREEKERKYKQAIKRHRLFPAIGLAVTVMVILLFLVDFGAVYNSDMGKNEVKISGYNCVVAGICGNYDGTEKSIGDMAVPFNYYAHDYVKPMSIITAFAFFVVLLVAVLQIAMTATNRHGLAIPTAALSLVAAGLLIAAFAIGTSIRSSRILPVYCGGNPVCSIHSHAIFPALFALGNVATSILAFVKAKRAKRILE